MIFESFTFKPNPKKVKEDNRDKLFIGFGVAMFLLVYIFLFRGLIGLLILGGLSYTLIQLKVSDNKKKGASRFGSLVERLVLTTELLTVGDKQFRLNELSKFKINADDYLGKSNDFLGSSVGTDNFIEITQGGVDYSFQFQVKKQTDLKLLAQINREAKISPR